MAEDTAAKKPLSLLFGEKGIALSLECPLIIKPENYVPLLQDISEDLFEEFLHGTYEILSKSDYNSAILRTKNFKPLSSPLNSLLSIALDLPKEKLESIASNLIFDIIEKLVQSSPAEIEHYELIYETIACICTQELSRDAFNERYPALYVCRKLLDIFVKAHLIRLVKDPQCYFFFLPPNGRIEADLPHSTPWPFSTVFSKLTSLIGLYIHCMDQYY